MATKENGSGFLSKVAKFVRHPTKDWSELDQIGAEPEPEPDKGYSKQVLKEMIERKRRNDFVRGREFDQLRKLRRNIPVVSADANGRPSFFLSSTNGSNLDERASTIKKIDDIEAQMSKQWWKGKQEGAAVRSDPVSGSPGVSAPDTQRPIVTQAPAGKDSEFSQTQPPQAYTDSDLRQGRAYAPTQPLGLSAPKLAADLDTEPMLEFGNFGASHANAATKEFSLSGLFSVDLGDSLVDPDLEEAAIRFANRDDASAEAGLLTALRGGKARPDCAKGWAAALFDLYRATGQQDSFDRMAMECAERFGQAAPPWFSIPELLLSAGPACSLAVLAPWLPDSLVLWRCPAELALPALQTLQSSLPQAPQPWHLDWRALRMITPAAGQALAELFAQWCIQPVQLRFSGANALEQTLRSCTPAGDKQVVLFWWRLRLDALRIMRQQDDFELAALDYCVIHEASPPPWVAARCTYVDERTTAGPSASAVLQLQGEVLGDVSEALDKLQAGPVATTQYVISCDRLIRVDFSAAGSILNWVMARAAQGCQVQFRDVPYLVAAFFNIIGINEHAKVLLRSS